MPRQYDSSQAKSKVLGAAVGLFLENGYSETKIADICKASGVTYGSLFNVFKSKDGILYELFTVIFERLLEISKRLAGENTSAPILYAIDTSIKLAMTELHENMRNIFSEAYTHPNTLQYINRRAAVELPLVFGKNFKDSSETSFFEREIGSAGILHGYITTRCDRYFTLEMKIRRFLEMSLSSYRVPAEEQEMIIQYIMKMDLKPIADMAVVELTRILRDRFPYIPPEGNTEQ